MEVPIMEANKEIAVGEVSACSVYMVRSQPQKGQPFFTVFVPTYNRAATLPRLLDSLVRQTFTDFELLIVDDGSTDETQEILYDFEKHASIKVRCLRQHNQGRHIAFNKALDEAKGFLFTTLNSDDTLAENALERFYYWWHIGIERFSEDIKGVEALCADMNTHRIIGTPFPQSPMVADYIEVYYKRGCWGDAIRAIRKDIIAKYRFPQIPNERYIPPSYLWNQLGFDRHKVLYVNEILAFKEYRSDGVTRHRIRIRANNPRGAALYYHSFLESAMRDGRIPYRLLVRNASNWVRYSLFLHPTISAALKHTWRHIPRRDLWFPSVVIGMGLWLRDNLVLRWEGH
jgi:glycosyltransferase involved in cell wall biosynthesis